MLKLKRLQEFLAALATRQSRRFLHRTFSIRTCLASRHVAASRDDSRGCIKNRNEERWEKEEAGADSEQKPRRKRARLLNYPSPQLSRSVSSPPAHFVFHSRMFLSFLPSFLFFFYTAVSPRLPPPVNPPFYRGSSRQLGNRGALFLAVKSESL